MIKQKDGNNKDMHYAVQAYTYAIMSPICIDDVRIAYISKDDLCIEEVSVEKTYPNISSLYENDWFPLFEAWERQEEPKPNPTDWECKYCIYRSSCPHARGEHEGNFVVDDLYLTSTERIGKEE